jgi:outer membrane protein insertion porin family
MKFKGITVLSLIICSFVIFTSLIYAQTENPSQQFKLTEEKKSLSFKEGKTIISEVSFIGLDTEFQQDTDAGRAIQANNFLSALKYAKKAFVPDEKFNSEKVSGTMKFLKQWLASNGYLKADIIAFGEKLPQNRMKLIFSVKRNSPVLVSEIRFTGNKFISESEYIQTMRNCLGSKNFYDKDHYSYCAAKNVRDLIFSKGYFRGRIWGINPKFFSESFIISIKVSEGLRFLIGDISIEGATVFNEKDISEIIGIQTGDVANGPKLRDGVYEKLKREYLDKGYILFNAEFDPKYIEPKYEGQDGLVNITIEIDEGRKFNIRKIEFIGVEQEQGKELKKSFPLKNDEIFNRTKMEEGIKKLNETGKFYPIDSDRDVELFTSENSGEVFINIKLTKIE